MESSSLPHDHEKLQRALDRMEELLPQGRVFRISTDLYWMERCSMSESPTLLWGAALVEDPSLPPNSIVLE